MNTLGTVLHRRFNDLGDIVRIGRGTWGLLEWYPNRSFKKKAKEENGSDKEEAEPEAKSERIVPQPTLPVRRFGIIKKPNASGS